MFTHQLFPFSGKKAAWRASKRLFSASKPSQKEMSLLRPCCFIFRNASKKMSSLLRPLSKDPFNYLELVRMEDSGRFWTIPILMKGTEPWPTKGVLAHKGTLLYMTNLGMCQKGWFGSKTRPDNCRTPRCFNTCHAWLAARGFAIRDDSEDV